jgi:hypothetical protein
MQPNPTFSMLQDLLVLDNWLSPIFLLQGNAWGWPYPQIACALKLLALLVGSSMPFI